MSTYLNLEDFMDLLLKSMTAKNLPPFLILHGVSNNMFKRIDMEKYISIILH